jgi:hypothetical protein
MPSRAFPLLITVTIALSCRAPLDAGVSILFSSSTDEGSITFSYCNQPPPGYCLPPCWPSPPVICYPALPTYYCVPYRPPTYGYVYVPPYAYGGWSIGPPTVLTPPPSFYGFDKSARAVPAPTSACPAWALPGNPPMGNREREANARAETSSSGRKSAASPSATTEPLVVERVDSRTVMLRWNAENPDNIASVVFYTGDIFQSPLEARRVTQAPFTASMRLSSGVRNVGVTVTSRDGAQITHWVPYSPLSR